MAHRTCSQNLQMAEQVKRPKAFTKRRSEASEVLVQLRTKKNSCPTRCEENTHTNADQLTDVLKQSDVEWYGECSMSRLSLSGTLQSAESNFVPCAGVSQTEKRLMQEVMGNFHDHAINIAEQSVVDMLKTSGVHHSITFFIDALKSSLTGWLVFILGDLSSVRKPFHEGTVQEETVSRPSAITGSAAARDT